MLEKTLESHWTARRSNQSVLKEISPEYSLKGLMLKLTFQYFSYLMGRADKDREAGKDCRQEEKEMTEDGMVGWHYWFNGHEFEQALGIGDGQESLVCYSPRVAKSQTKLSSWTKLNFNLQSISLSKFSHSSTDNLGIHSTTFQEQRFPERKAKKKRASQLCQSVPHGIPA